MKKYMSYTLWIVFGIIIILLGISFYVRYTHSTRGFIPTEWTNWEAINQSTSKPIAFIKVPKRKGQYDFPIIITIEDAQRNKCNIWVRGCNPENWLYESKHDNNAMFMVKRIDN